MEQREEQRSDITKKMLIKKLRHQTKTGKGTGRRRNRQRDKRGVLKTTKQSLERRGIAGRMEDWGNIPYTQERE